MAVFLQERDFHIFRELAECRFLTLSQIAATCFTGSREAAKKRLQKLQKAGLVKRRSPRILAPSLYLLTASGMKSISVNRPVSYKAPAETTLKHEIAVRDFRAKLLAAVAETSSTLEVLSIDSQALAFDLENCSTRPDGYFEIRTDVRISRFFFEIDNGTEPYRTLLERVNEYLAFYKSGLFAERCGGGLEHFRRYPFRVLFQFSSETRMRSFVGQLRKNGVADFIVAIQRSSATDPAHFLVGSSQKSGDTDG
jgi:hypothetical protein